MAGGTLSSSETSTSRKKHDSCHPALEKEKKGAAVKRSKEIIRENERGEGTLTLQPRGILKTRPHRRKKRTVKKDWPSTNFKFSLFG